MLKRFIALFPILLNSAVAELPELSVPDGRPIDFSNFSWYNELPEGREADEALQHQSFYSVANQVDVGYYLYLPAGYYEPSNRHQRYPSVYYLHGGRPGSESKGLNRFFFFREAMESGERPPCIYVIVNGGRLSHYDWGEAKGETAFLELVDHIDQTYRTLDNRRARAVEGASQGGRGTTRYILKHPHLFGTAIAMASGYQWEQRISARKGVESAFLTIDDGNNNVWNLAAEYAKDESSSPVNLLIVVGDQDDNYESNVAYHNYLDDLGIEHAFYVAKGDGHSIDFATDSTRHKIMSFLTDSLRSYGIDGEKD